MIFISGDLRDAVYNCTWQPRWDTEWANMSLGYFAGKMTAHTGGKYTWGNDEAVWDLKSRYEEFIEDLNKVEFDELTECIKLKQISMEIKKKENLSKLPYHNRVDSDVLLQFSLTIGYAINSGNEYEYNYNIRNDLNFKDFNNFWEWGYKCGKRFNDDIKWYLVGLQMAYKQLKGK